MKSISSAIFTNLNKISEWKIKPFGRAAKVPVGELFKMGNFQWLLAHDFSSIAAKWPTDPGNQFLSAAYLSALEHAAPNDASCSYLLVFEKNEAVAGFLIQQMSFNTRRSVKSLREATGTGWGDRMKRLLSKVGNFKALVLGNLLLTGENGYWTTLPAMRFEPLFLQTLKLMEQLAKQLGIGAMMVKDFFQRDLVVEAAGYHPLSFQPAMVLELPPEWKSFDDYIEAMSSKYRVRTRRAYKKGQSIDFKSLAIQEIELRNAELYELYLQVLDNADFNALTAHPDYFLQLKRHLKEDFDLVGCFIQQQLVGFFTTIRNHEELECHFIGLEASSNREHQVYLNMLYRMVEKGIQLGVHQISMARTALEIKSSVGAVAHQQFSYLRHRLPVLNHILPYVVRFMEPQEQWIPRHPFSKNETP